MLSKQFKHVAVLAFVLILALDLTQIEAAPEGKIKSKILSDLQAKGTVTFFVVMKEKANSEMASGITDWDRRGEIVISLLKGVANRTQRPIFEIISRAGAEATSYWIVNTVKVTTKDLRLIEELAGHTDVEYLKADELLQIPDPISGSAEPKIQGIEWGISKIRAPEVWQQFNIRGEGIVVANIDTGVKYDHPALVRQYRGNLGGGRFDHNYNWFDPSRICSPGTPCDNNGHGSHTMGTIVGDDGDPGPNQIGVAPRAKWIAVKGCESISCSTSALLSSGQWVLEPTDLNGQNPRRDLRPHVVNNSWGSGSGSDPFYRELVVNWRNAGIFPAFANGNPGSACGRVGVPGAYPESFGVGATDSNDNIAGFSARGPAAAFGNIVKPQASAPGVNVRSAWNNGNYNTESGTSMATPHVAGTVALMWSSNPAIVGDISTTSEILQTTARFRSSTQCGAAGPPNNVYGWGIIDALGAVQEVVRGGTLQGRVTDASSATPVAGAQIQAVGPVTRATQSDANGNYRVRLIAGGYTVTADSFGYRPQTVTGIQIRENQTTTQNFSLPSLPRYLIRGSVWSSADGQPIAGAEVKILTTPISPARSDTEGNYEFRNVPEGTYDIQAGIGRCIATLTQRVTISTDVEVNFPLDSRDAFGYACDDNIPFAWVDAENLLLLFGDSSSIRVNLPFTFSFYGEGYDSVFVSTNGFVNFLENRTYRANNCIPNPDPPNAAIYAHWDSWNVFPFVSGVFTKSEGEAPNRRFIIEWRNVTKRLFIDAGTFEIILDEASGSITLQYNQARGVGDGSSATIGIENQDGRIGFQYSCNEPVVSVGKAIKYFLAE
ncbi:MAG: S8 family serine peptidase [Acidobacteria bacterium]|nr:S8 family serine peptidase [Acidobacteriota bacterium]MBI3656440.1 S8 family serine peptidase [Acidobacteriota bacterium]